MSLCYQLVFCLVLATVQQSKEPATDKEKPAASQPAAPASQPANSQMPRDADYLKELIRETERQPLNPPKGAPPATTPEKDAGASKQATRDANAIIRGKTDALYDEGAMIVERSGRLCRAGEQIEFVLNRDDGKGTLRLELLPCKLMEELENEISSGVNQAVVTGEITRYKNRTFLLLRNYRRQTDRGNLSP